MLVHIHYANGSRDSYARPTMREAMRLARDGISYSGGRVRRVEIETERDAFRAVWDASWDAISQAAGLRDAP